MLPASSIIVSPGAMKLSAARRNAALLVLILQRSYREAGGERLVESSYGATTGAHDQVLLSQIVQVVAGRDL